MLAESMVASGQDASGPSGPPLRTWSPEVRLLTQIKDAVRHLEWTVLASQIGKKAGEQPTPSPHPSSLLEVETKRAEYNRKMAAHKALTKRLLPHKSD